MPVGAVASVLFVALFAVTDVALERLYVVVPFGVAIVISGWLRHRERCVAGAAVYVLGALVPCTLGTFLRGPLTPAFFGFLALLCFAIPTLGTRWGVGIVAWMGGAGGGHLIARHFDLLPSFTPLAEYAVFGSGFVIAVVTVLLLKQPTGLLVRLAMTERARREEVEVARQREREAASKLQQASLELAATRRLEALGKLSGGIAHDFNNMLSVIRGASELITKIPDYESDPKLVDNVELINMATLRAAELTRSLLAFGRSEGLIVQRVDVNEVVHDVATLARPTLGHVANLEVQCAEGPLFVHCDRSALSQALLNLVLNARDAVSPRGIIRIETRAAMLEREWCDLSPFDIEPGEVVHISLQDNGGGMSEEVRRRVFEPFFTTKELGRGTGLGLSAVHGTISSHRGAIEVNSELGRGTVFQIYLPLNPSEAQPSPRRADQTGARPRVRLGSSGVRALVVDDDDLSRRAVTRLLEQLGVECEEKKSGEEALEALDTGADIALVLSDVVMPDLDGPAFVKEVLRRHPDIGVVLMSGFAPDGLLHALPTHRSIPLLRKPFSSKELHAALEAASRSSPRASSSA